MKQLTKAVINVMNEVKNIEKGTTVGQGQYTYKGVADKDVKRKIGDAMAKNGLILLPIEIEPQTRIERWEEQGRSKQLVFVEVKTKYQLLHESGESIEISGYGHGTDSQDKAAGKATTYALKYALLYSFLVPTGSIDDADTDHSNTNPTPPAKKQETAQAYYKQNAQTATTAEENPWLNLTEKNGTYKPIFRELKDKQMRGEEVSMKTLLKKYRISNNDKAIIEVEFGTAPAAPAETQTDLPF